MLAIRELSDLVDVMMLGGQAGVTWAIGPCGYCPID